MAAIPFLADIDLAKNALLNASVQPLAVAPADPVVGQLYFDTALSKLRVWTGTEWADASGTGTGTGTGTGGPAGGDLQGEYPNPTLRAGVVADAEVAADAAIALSKLAVDPTDRANHTGTQPTSSIAGFDAAVKAIADVSAAAVVDGSPNALNTLKELAAALGNDADFATTITNRIAAIEQAKTRHVQSLAGSSGTTVFVTHGLNEQYVSGSVFDNSRDKVEVYSNVYMHDANTVRLTFNAGVNYADLTVLVTK